MEIECKFLCQEVPQSFLKAYDHKTSLIEQFYLATGDEQVRVRAIMPLTPNGNNKYVITVKRSHVLVRNKMEVEVSEWTFI